MPEDYQEREERSSSFGRLGNVEGKIDILLKLRENDSVLQRDFRADMKAVVIEMTSEVKSAVISIRDELKATAQQVTTLTAEVRNVKDDLSSIAHIVRDGDNQSLVHRVATMEQAIHNMKNKVMATKTENDEVVRALAEQIDTKMGQLHEAIREMSTNQNRRIEAITEENHRRDIDNAAQNSVDQIVKDKEAHNKKIFLLILGTLVTLLASLAAAAIQYIFSSHWK